MSKVYLYRAGFAGDVVIATGAVRALAKARPELEIHFGCWPQYRPLVELNPRLAGVWPAEWRLHRRQWPGGWSNLEHERFMGAGEYWGICQARCLGADGIIPFSDLDVGEIKPEIWIDETDIFTWERSEKRRLAVIQPWSLNGKNWRLWVPMNRWAEIVKRLKEDGWFVAQVGLKNEPLVEGVVDLRGQTTLRQLVGLLTQADLVLTIDSLLLHLAAADIYVGDENEPRPKVPCIAIVGPIPTKPYLVPGGCRNIIEVSARPDDARCPCVRSFGSMPCELHNACMRALTVERVWETIKEAIKC